MKEFSWHTDDKPNISTYINGAPKKRYLVVDGIAVVGRAVMHYKPNRKAHKEEMNAYQREWYLKNRDKILAKRKAKGDMKNAED